MQWFWLLESLREGEKRERQRLKIEFFKDMENLHFAFCMNTHSRTKWNKTRENCEMMSFPSSALFIQNVPQQQLMCIFLLFHLFTIHRLALIKRTLYVRLSFSLCLSFQMNARQDAFCGFIRSFSPAFFIKSCCNFQTSLVTNRIYALNWVKRLVYFGKNQRHSSPLTSSHYELPWIRKIYSIRKKNTHSSYNRNMVHLSGMQFPSVWTDGCWKGLY